MKNLLAKLKERWLKFKCDVAANLLEDASVQAADARQHYLQKCNELSAHRVLMARAGHV